MHRKARTPVRCAFLFLAALAAVATAGCASDEDPAETGEGAADVTAEGAESEPGAEPAKGAGDTEGTGEAGAEGESPDGKKKSSAPRRGQRATGMERAGQYALAVPENIVWVPWKIIGGGFKGASDGVQAGFAKGRLPLFGVIFSPVNLVVGLGTGMVEGLVMSPGLVGPDDDFGRAMSLPTKRSTSIWWYP